MRKLRTWAGPICHLMVLTLIFLQFPVGLAKASIISTERILEAKGAQKERKRVLAFMARKEVRAKMVSYGVDPKEATARVKALSDKEIKMVAAKIDSLPAGQDGAGTVLAVILIAFLVLLATDLMGATDVFPFVKKVRN